jgi:hypothetical protein
MVFPLRPGETQFEIAYHLPYSGQAKIEARPVASLEHFVVMLPKQMTFDPGSASIFQNMPDDSGANVQVATSVKAGQAIAFNVSGTGVLQGQNGETGGAGAAQGGAAAAQAQAGNAANRPGGGLGPPIDAPDPLHSYRWYLLGGVVLLLGVGAVMIVTRHAPTPAAAKATAAGNGTRRSAAAAAVPPAQGHSELLLEALKEEMFQLEMDKQQGRISAEEYQKSKAALDNTLQRAIRRRKSS